MTSTSKRPKRSTSPPETARVCAAGRPAPSAMAFTDDVPTTCAPVLRATRPTSMAWSWCECVTSKAACLPSWPLAKAMSDARFVGLDRHDQSQDGGTGEETVAQQRGFAIADLDGADAQKLRLQGIGHGLPGCGQGQAQGQQCSQAPAGKGQARKEHGRSQDARGLDVSRSVPRAEVRWVAPGA